MENDVTKKHNNEQPLVEDDTALDDATAEAVNGEVVVSIAAAFGVSAALERTGMATAIGWFGREAST